MNAKVKIAKDSFGSTHIWVDDADVSSACRGYTLRHPSPAEMPTLELVLNAHAIMLDGEVDIYINESTRAMLVGFGWTPPEEKP